MQKLVMQKLVMQKLVLQKLVMQKLVMQKLVMQKLVPRLLRFSLLVLLSILGATCVAAPPMTAPRISPPAVSRALPPSPIVLETATRTLDPVSLTLRATVHAVVAETTLTLVFPPVEEGKARFRIDLPADARARHVSVMQADRTQRLSLSAKFRETADTAPDGLSGEDPATLLLELDELTPREAVTVKVDFMSILVLGRYAMDLRALPSTAMDVEVSLDGGAAVREQRKAGFDLSIPTEAPGIAFGNEEEMLAFIPVRGTPSSTPLASVIVLFDTSASMKRSLGRASRIVHALATSLDPEVPLEVVAFDQEAELAYSGKAGGFGATEAAQIAARRALGMSNVDGALDFADTRTRALGARRHRVVLVTDRHATYTVGEAVDRTLASLGEHGADRFDVILADGAREAAPRVEGLARGPLPRIGRVFRGAPYPSYLRDRLEREVVTPVTYTLPGRNFLLVEEGSAGDLAVNFIAPVPDPKATVIGLVGGNREIALKKILLPEAITNLALTMEHVALSWDGAGSAVREALTTEALERELATELSMFSVSTKPPLAFFGAPLRPVPKSVAPSGASIPPPAPEARIDPLDGSLPSFEMAVLPNAPAAKPTDKPTDKPTTTQPVPDPADAPEPVVPSRIPPETIQLIVRLNAPRLRACYMDTLRLHPKFEGRVPMRFVIAEDGTVAEVNDVGDEPRPKELSTCMKAAYKAMSFPAPGNAKIVVTYPFTFHRTENGDTSADRGNPLVAGKSIPPTPKFVSVLPERFDARWEPTRHGIAAIAYKSPEHALSLALSALDERELDPFAHLLVGEIALLAGDTSLAARSYGAVAELWPKDEGLVLAAHAGLDAAGREHALSALALGIDPAPGASRGNAIRVRTDALRTLRGPSVRPGFESLSAFLAAPTSNAPAAEAGSTPPRDARTSRELTVIKDDLSLLGNLLIAREPTQATAVLKTFTALGLSRHPSPSVRVVATWTGARRDIDLIVRLEGERVISARTMQRSQGEPTEGPMSLAVRHLVLPYAQKIAPHLVLTFGDEPAPVFVRIDVMAFDGESEARIATRAFAVETQARAVDLGRIALP